MGICPEVGPGWGWAGSIFKKCHSSVQGRVFNSIKTSEDRGVCHGSSPSRSKNGPHVEFPHPNSGSCRVLKNWSNYEHALQPW